MADEEKAPLLKFSEDDENEGPRQRLHQMRQTDALRGITGFTDGTISISASASVSSNLTETSDHIVCVFVVTFDTRSGNMIEWCMPEDFDLDGVEFKAMVSGSHTQIKDFVYFRKDNMYGLACFENMPVQSEIERGARMKSVGILSTSYTLLYKHMQFLETQVRHQLETPGKYSQLHAFYEDKKGTLSSSDTQEIIRMPTPASTPSTSSREFLPEMKITHPAGCFSQFMKFFGVQIFVLWKFALLQQRILFFSPPPIGVVCYRVYCACCLSKHDLGAMGHNVKPHFYVNVADIETLESEVSYIACTTEKIFESKPNLYDVYVDNQVLKTSSLHLNDLLKVSNADREKYTKLNNQRSESRFSFEQLGEEADNEEELFTIMQTSEFLLPEQSLHIFKSKNQPLLSTYIALTLLDVSCTQDRQLTSEHMKGMGLDPNGDRAFLMELVEHYGIDVVLMVDNPCCPK